MEGSMVLSETLANYSALMMLRKLRGEAEMRRGLQFLRDRYLASRAAGGSVEEPPLARVENQNWIGYHKGALAMYLLQERMGEDAVNRALRNLLQRSGSRARRTPARSTSSRPCALRPGPPKSRI
jgi:aminopeptidase N